MSSSMSSTSFGRSQHSTPYFELDSREKIKYLNQFTISLTRQLEEGTPEETIKEKFYWLTTEVCSLERRFGAINQIQNLQSRVTILNELLTQKISIPCTDDDISPNNSASSSSTTLEDDEPASEFFAQPSTPSQSSSSSELLESTGSSLPQSHDDKMLSILRERLEASRDNPLTIYSIVWRYIKSPQNSEQKLLSLTYLQRAVDAPIERWLNCRNIKGYNPRIARLTSALHIALAYQNGCHNELRPKEIQEKIEHYYKIALERYGNGENDYLGISWYNRACLLEARIQKARERGRTPESLIKAYKTCFTAYVKSLHVNQPIERSSDVLYNIANMYYEIILLKSELKIEDATCMRFVGTAFDYCLESLHLLKVGTDRKISAYLENTISTTPQGEYEIEALLLLGHIMTQDFFIPNGSKGRTRFDGDLEQQRMCGFYAYRAALSHLKHRPNYIDVLGWAIESCTTLADKGRGKALAALLLPRVSEIRDKLSDEETHELRANLIKLGFTQGYLVRKNILPN